MTYRTDEDWDNLIGAAPKMLDALEDALDCLQNLLPPGPPTDIERKIIAAIALAKGESK